MSLESQAEILQLLKEGMSDDELLRRGFSEHDLISAKIFLKGADLSDLKRIWHENFHIEDDAPLIIMLAVAATNFLPGDPVWLFLVGPPSTIKTEMIRSLGDEPGDMVWPLSTLTANTLMSGQGKKYSLLPKLDGKILAIKDFTSILEKNKDARNEILAQLRETYDGYFSKGTGNEEGAYQHQKCKLTLIGGVTNVIDLFDSFQGLLGDRFLKVRVKAGNSRKVGTQAAKTAGKEEEVRRQLHQVTLSFLHSLRLKQFDLEDD